MWNYTENSCSEEQKKQRLIVRTKTKEWGQNKMLLKQKNVEMVKEKSWGNIQNGYEY